MPIFLRFSNIEFLIQIFLKIVRNMQNSIKTRGNLCTELGPPVFNVVFVRKSKALCYMWEGTGHFAAVSFSKSWMVLWGHFQITEHNLWEGEGDGDFNKFPESSTKQLRAWIEIEWNSRK